MRKAFLPFFLALVASAAFPGDPPTDPVLTINARMHTSTVRHIDTDAAGRILLTGSLDKSARLWDAATGDLLRVLRPPLSSGNDGKIYAVALSPDGKTAVVGGWTGYDWDGKVSLYLFDAANGELIRKVPGLENTPYDLRFSPDGTRIAVGFQDASEVQILDASTLEAVRRLSFEKAHDNEYLGVVRWDRDGATLWCAGVRWSRQGEDWRNSLRHWDLADGGFLEYPVSLNSIMDLRVLPDGSVAWCGYLPDMGRMDASGRSLFTLRSESMAFTTDRKDHLRLAADGMSIGFEPLSAGPFTFYLANRQLTRAQSSLPSALASAGGTEVTDWAGTTAPRINGKTLSILGRNEVCRSAAVTPSGKTVVFGTDWNVICTDASGRTLWKTYSPAATWTVQVAEEAGVALAAFGDGTIRWFRLRDGAELLALFAHPDGSRWVLWTPSGYFDCSPGGQDLVGWSVNGAGGARAADFFPAGSFSSRFYRPDVTQTILKTLDEKTAVAEADRKRAVQPERADLLASLPPVVTIRSSEDDALIASTTIRMEADVRTPNADPALEVRALVDGRPSGASLTGLAISSRTGERVTLDVPLPSGEHQVFLIARNSSGWSLPSGITASRGQLEKAPAATPSRLFALLAGAAADLKASAARSPATPDGAEALASALLSRKGAPYADVTVDPLWGAYATMLTTRLRELAESTSLADTVLLVLRGFGASGAEGGRYLLADAADESDPKTRGLSMEDVAAALSVLPARVAVFLEIQPLDDGFDLTGLVNGLARPETGAAVTARRPAAEAAPSAASGPVGLLQLLAEGAAGKADVTGDGAVSVNEMALFLADRLGKSGGVLSAKPETVRDFPLLASPAAAK